MLKRLVSLLYIIIFVGGLCNAQTISKHEYWIDDDYNQRQVVLSSVENISISVDIKNIPAGVHYFNFRAENSDGIWGALTRYIFLVPDRKSENVTINDYEYWFDDDYSNKTQQTSSTAEIAVIKDISALSEGIHYLNFRARNTDGYWGALTRYVFLVQPKENTSVSIQEYEYWIDDDYAGKEILKSSNANFNLAMDVSSLDEGIHYFNFRARNIEGKWGALTRYIFMKSNELQGETSPIVGYKYGFGNKETWVDVNATSELKLTDLAIPIPVATEFGVIDENCNFSFDEDVVKMERYLSATFSIQFKNQANKWSSPVCQEFSQTDEITHNTIDLEISGSVTFDKVTQGDYCAFKTSIASTGTYYLKSSQPCKINIYKTDGTLYRELSSEELLNVCSVSMAAGTYFGIVHSIITNETYNSNQVSIRLMTTNNIVSSPTISFADGKASMACAQAGANIYYTLDGSTPSIESSIYSAPIDVLRNCTIKAIATYDDMTPSDVVSFVVDSYKTNEPTIKFANLKLYMECVTPESFIYYTLDGTDPASNGQLYSEPVSVSQSCIVKAVAKRDGYNYSDITTYNLDVENVKCDAPEFTRDGNTLYLNSLTEGAIFYYTLDGENPTATYEKYEGSIMLTHNGVVKAYAVKEGLINSETASYTVDWFKTEAPEFALEGNVLTITCGTPNAEIYYTFGNAIPDKSSIKYESPFELNGNVTVKAIAYAEHFNESEISVFSPESFVCEPVLFKYNGRYISLESATKGATIYYTLNGSTPTTESIKYSNPIDVNGLITIKAYAVKADYKDAEMTSYITDYYYNGSDVLTSKCGLLNKAFEWCGIESVSKLNVTGYINGEDMLFLSSISSLKHLILDAATLEDNKIPANAFRNANFISICFPNTIEYVENDLFVGCKNLAAIQWNSSVSLPSSALNGINNPNLLIYTKLRSYIPTSVKNVVVNGVAENVTLVDTEDCGNFYCPIEFTAKQISYKHTYTMETPIGGCAGWETIALPFDVDSYKHAEKGEAAPFAANNVAAKQFWLYELTESGFIMADKIKANTPYIISMPNNINYADEYILEGEITFSANNVTVPITERKSSAKGDFVFMPTTLKIEKDKYIYLINKDEDDSMAPGSMFVSEIRPVKPFESYLSFATSTHQLLPIKISSLGFDGNTSGNAIPVKDNMNIWSKDGVLYIESPEQKFITIYSYSGIIVRNEQLQQGINTIEGLQGGLYIIGGNKIMVK